MKNSLKVLLLSLFLMLGSLMPAAAQVTYPYPAPAVLPAGSCLAEDYVGTKLRLCIYMCEQSWRFTKPQLDAMLRSWLSLYRDAPPCYL